MAAGITAGGNVAPEEAVPALSAPASDGPSPPLRRQERPPVRHPHAACTWLGLPLLELALPRPQDLAPRQRAAVLHVRDREGAEERVAVVVGPALALGLPAPLAAAAALLGLAVDVGLGRDLVEVGLARLAVQVQRAGPVAGPLEQPVALLLEEARVQVEQPDRVRVLLARRVVLDVGRLPLLGQRVPPLVQDDLGGAEQPAVVDVAGAVAGVVAEEAASQPLLRVGRVGRVLVGVQPVEADLPDRRFGCVTRTPPPEGNDVAMFRETLSPWCRAAPPPRCGAGGAWLGR